jgi:hypothetical protein
MKCPKGYMYCKMMGTCVHKKKKSARFGATKKKVDKQRTVNILAAKKLLRTNYSMLVNGKMKAPSFITTLKGVNGKSGAEKVANLRRVLSTCKKEGIPLLKKNTKSFKSYRTLVSQCKVKFSMSMSSSVLNQKRGLEANQKASARLESKLKDFKKKLALKRAAKKMSPLLLDNKPYVSEEFYDSSPNFDYSQEYEEALKTPLPEFGRRRRIRRIPGNQFGYFNFGLLRNLKFGKKHY